MLDINKGIEYKVDQYRIHPRVEAAIVMFIVCTAIFITAFFIYLRALNAQKGEISEGLERSAQIVATTLIDSELHKTFLTQEQKTSPSYLQAVKPFSDIQKASPALKYIWTVVLRKAKDGKEVVHFVLDPVPPTQPDTVKVMEVYKDASPDLFLAFHSKKPVVSKEPFTDQWGTWITAYVPFFDKKNELVGVVGMTMDASNYIERLKPIKHATVRALVTGFSLSLLMALGTWFLRRFADEINKSRLTIMGHLREAVDIAQKATKMKSDFLANMSHELRTPMNAVLGFTKSLLDSPLNAMQRDHVETMQEAGNSLINIVNEILDLSKLEVGKINLLKEDMDLYKLLENVTNLLSTQTQKKGTELCLVVNPSVPVAVKGDQGRIRQVLINIIGNAIKFTQEGGVVLEVNLLREEEERYVMQFKVVDSGIGIEKEAIGKIFEEFSQANDKIQHQFGGTGLGLALSRKLIQLMEGDVVVESEVGKGTTFSFTLALDKSLISSATLESAKEGIIKKALVVDNNKVLGESLVKQLDLLGVKTHYIQDGDVKKAAEKHAVEVVMLDSNMPGVWTLIEAFKNDPKTSHIRLLLLHHNTETTNVTENTLVDAHLTKPLRMKALLKALKV